MKRLNFIFGIASWKLIGGLLLVALLVLCMKVAVENWMYVD